MKEWVTSLGERNAAFELNSTVLKVCIHAAGDHVWMQILTGCERPNGHLSFGCPAFVWRSLFNWPGECRNSYRYSQMSNHAHPVTDIIHIPCVEKENV